VSRTAARSISGSRANTRCLWSGCVLVPILHAFVLLAAFEAAALMLHVPALINMGTRLVCIAPFIGASIFVLSNEAYVDQFKTRIAGLAPDEVANRRQSARLFALVSVVGGVGSLLFLVFVQMQRSAT
jgi:hypothetical protein